MGLRGGEAIHGYGHRLRPVRPTLLAARPERTSSLRECVTQFLLPRSICRLVAPTLLTLHLDDALTVHHDVGMRTTMTLDDDVVDLIEEATRRERRSMKEVVNDALRRALRAEQTRPYRVDVHFSQLRPGIDTERLNELADDEDDSETIARVIA